MADILWGPYQVRHIERRHGVRAREFEDAWDDPGREELGEEDDPDRGPAYLSLGATSDGRLVMMVWRWQWIGEAEVVFPITAFFKEAAPRTRRNRRPRRRRRQ